MNVDSSHLVSFSLKCDFRPRLPARLHIDRQHLMMMMMMIDDDILSHYVIVILLIIRNAGSAYKSPSPFLLSWRFRLQQQPFARSSSSSSPPCRCRPGWWVLKIIVMMMMIRMCLILMIPDVEVVLNGWVLLFLTRFRPNVK